MFILTSAFLNAEDIKIELILDVHELPLYVSGGPEIHQLTVHNGVLYNYFRPATGDNYIYKTNLSNINWTLLGRDTSIYELVDHGDGTFGRFYKEDKKPAYWGGVAIFDEPFTYFAASNSNYYKYNGESIDCVTDTIPSFEYLNRFYFVRNIDSKSAVMTGLRKIYIIEENGNSFRNITPDPIKLKFYNSSWIVYQYPNIIDKSNYFVTLYADTNNPNSLESNRHYSLLKTNDAGKTWERITTLDSTNNGYKMAGICFIDSNNGWWVGTKYIKPIPTGNKSSIILHTTDGGKNWEVQLDTTILNHYTMEYIDFYDKNFGVAHSFGGVYYTYDGGKKWNYLNFKDDFDILYVRVSAFSFIDDKSFVIGTEDGRVFKVTLDPPISVETTSEFKSILYPNPVSDRLSLSFTSSKETEAKLGIIDLLGNIVSITKHNIFEGNNTLQVTDLNILHTGIYTLLLKINNEIVCVEKFMKD